MKSYHETMDNLRFTPEQKRQITNRLLEAGTASPRRLTRRRIGVLAAAAVLAVTAGTAAAAGVFRSAGEVFSWLLGTEAAQTEIINKIGYPIGASDTDHGVTITADAIIGDRYSYAIVYSIQRQDGGSLLPETAAADNGALPLTFRQEESGLTMASGGGSGLSYFYDADPEDSAIQYVVMMTQDTPLGEGTARVRFGDLYAYDSWAHMEEQTLIAQGSWSLEFDFRFEDTSLVLPGGQTFQIGGAEAVLDQVTLSPLSIQVAYTVDTARQGGQIPEETSSGGADSPQDQDPAERFFNQLPITLHLKDGSTLELSGLGGSMDTAGETVVCTQGGLLPGILPLEQVEGVTVGTLTLPVGEVSG